ncbi:MAG: DUF3857 domain-containing protein [Muribaculaceae bacterium]|nr:DUF3857 domain-containing protein [Muribaculaceae bacterium]
MKTSRLLSLFILLSSLAVFSAKADEAEDYRIFADEVKSAVYSTEMPEFEVREIPEKYADASAVFVAIYHELNARKKTGFGHLPGTIRFSAKARVEGGELCRMLIYINDKAGLEKFSEFDFATDMKKKMSNAHRKQRHVMGVRVIKPDGTINDVNTDEFVEVEEGKKNKEKRRKLAVPGLEVGDMIDVFFYTAHKLQNVHLEPMTYYLRDIYPIMNYHVHAVVDDNLTTQYRTLNGAPDFAVSRDDDKNYVLDMTAQDIAAEPRLWYSSDEQSPLVKLYVYNRRSDAYTPNSARKDGLQQNPDPKEIKKDFWIGRELIFHNGQNFVNYYLKNGAKAVKEISKQLKKGEIDSVAAADYLYNLLTLAYFVSDENLYHMRFGLQLNDLLRGLGKVKYYDFVTTDNEEEAVDELASMFNAEGGICLLDGKRHYLTPRAIISPSELHGDFIGRKYQSYHTDKYIKQHPEVDTIYRTLPETSPEQNRNVSEMKVRTDGTSAVIDRRESRTGVTKLGVQHLLTAEDIVNAYLSYLNRSGAEVSLKGNNKKAADRQERYNSERQEQQDAFKQEVEDSHKNQTEFISGNVEQVGIDPDAPELIYNVSYKMDGFVKQAGKNKIMSVGNLLGGQTELLTADRERNDDIVMSSPREFVVRADIELPAGYRVSEKALDALRREVKNEAGLFTVTAEAKGGHVIIEITKRYNHRHEPAGLWRELTEIVDAASAWQSSTLLLEQ